MGATGVSNTIFKRLALVFLMPDGMQRKLKPSRQDYYRRYCYKFSASSVVHTLRRIAIFHLSRMPVQQDNYWIHLVAY